MGSVWEAYDATLERTVAVKELIRDPTSGEPIEIRVERARREALALARVEHPAIVIIHDLIYVWSAEDPWIVMGYARGRSLEEIVAAEGALAERQVASIGLAVLAGLVACHKQRVWHRDVKPANIVVGADGSVRLVDFGIVRMAGQASLTATSNLLGTPLFLAPELLNGERPAGPATDLWALGVTLYCALTGEPPFNAPTLQAIYAAIIRRDPPVPSVGGPLADLVMRMLRKDPATRPDADQIAVVLRNCLVRGGAGDPRPRSGPNRAAGSNTQPLRLGPTLAPYSALPALDVASAANLVNRSDDTDGGRLLSAIASADPAQGREILEMFTLERAGRLLDQMSPLAAAAAMSRPPTDEAVLILDRADTRTIVEALSEMPPDIAASLLLEMDAGHGVAAPGRAVEVLGGTAVATAAAILTKIAQPRRKSLLARLPPGFSALISQRL